MVGGWVGVGGSLFVFLCASVLSWSHWKSPLIAIIHPHAEISLNFSYPLPTNSPTKRTKQPRSVAAFLWFTEDLQQCHNHINILAYASRTIWWILRSATRCWGLGIKHVSESVVFHHISQLACDNRVVLCVCINIRAHRSFLSAPASVIWAYRCTIMQGDSVLYLYVVSRMWR